MIILPERPGMLTPLAPWTESMTPWAKTLVEAKATRRIADEYCILNEWVYGRRKQQQLLKIVEVGNRTGAWLVTRDRYQRRTKKVAEDADDGKRVLGRALTIYLYTTAKR